MPTTANRAYRYPASTDHTRIWEHVQNLASDVDTDVAGLANPAWTNLTLAAGFQNAVSLAGPVPQYRIRGALVWVNFRIERTAAALFTLNTEFIPFAAGALPVAARPVTRPILHWAMSQFSNTNPPLVRLEVKTDGSIGVNATQASGTAPTWIQANFGYEAAL